ncbi:aromatic acid exporter family protein [Microbacterium sp. LRZ72]|uniref:FUSC family protein n=1 Tax=Microbacterium sp. LRZ72 TaxID=2942481 RepID=UPI0029BAB2C8|nr:FUSC family protein [Microbacterium sp. LRZ72]MDX2375234.1 aromatic acid exporter family protein [Microbacterium sp. LRZ72]
MRMTSAIRASRRTPLLQVAKSAIATIAAWFVAGWLVPGPPPVFAAIAALLVVQPSLNQSYLKAIERSVGVVVGVVVASVLAMLLGETAGVVAVVIVIALVIAWALRMTSGTANQVVISALLVLALGAATPNYAFDRVIETIIGAAIGVIVHVAIVPPVTLAPARRAVADLAEELAASLDRLADALTTPRSAAELDELLEDARRMRDARDEAAAAIADARESLTLNPRARRHRDELAGLSALVDRLGPIVTQSVGMTRALDDRYDVGVCEEPAVGAIGDQLHRAAGAVRRGLARVRAGDAAASEPVVDEPPALTAPLQTPAPSPDHWVLIGALLEDLRRIHGALRETG